MSQLEEFDYELPRELIAQQPLRQRSDARLLVVDRRSSSWSHHHVRDLPELLVRGDRLVVNDTQVIAARLVGYRTATNGRWEGLFLNADANGNWLALGQTRGKIQPGETVTLLDRQGVAGLELTVVARLENGRTLLHPDSDETLWQLLDQYGRVPIPPYIRSGEMTQADVENYQTMFAAERGAVAAPTAGLHFTEALIAALKDHGIETAQVTLHVGEGTFRPISVENLEDHRMHAERGTVPAATVDKLLKTRQAGGRVIAVGTTTTRLLETAGRSGTLAAWQGATDLFIRPPFEFRVLDGLMTNFHLPRSSLLVLVSAFAGAELTREAYRAAVAERYRFYSYGDAMLIL